jgi:hypothetical protein
MNKMLKSFNHLAIAGIFFMSFGWPISVTFQVDMNNETVGTNGVHVAGAFQGWDPATTALADTNSDGIYSVTVDTFQAGDTFEYKYINGNAWGEDEFQGAPNRSITIPDTNIVLPPYCFNSLILCSEVNVTFNVDMNFEVVSASGVHVAGAFQGWDPAATELFDDDGDGIYSVTLPLTSGETFEYKYINGDSWGQDELQGQSNRSLTVGTEDMVLPDYCFNSLELCVYDAEGVWVTFQVDMSYQIINETDGIHIAGSFQGWDPGATELSDADGDMVYEVTLDIFTSNGDTVSAGDSVYYKFINGDEWGEDENIGADRLLVVPDTATVLVAPCFGSPDPCPAPPDSVDVTFVVDMLYETVSTSGVHVAGNFQGWDPAASELTDADGDGKYEITFRFEVGQALEYKFVNGDAWGSDEAVPDECASGGNRTLTAPNFDRPYEVCYETCDVCPEAPVTKVVIFSVDMTEWLDEDGATGMPIFSVSRGDQMQVRGGFNGWNCDTPEDCAMSRTPGSNIFSLAATLTDQAGHDNEYKFYLLHDSTSLELFEAEYGAMYGDMGWEDSPQFGGGNRHFMLGEDDGTGLLELPLSGYYDLPEGAVVPADQAISLTFSIDMTDAAADGFIADEDTVSVVLKDKWLNYLQGFGDNSTHNATANGDGTYSVTIDFVGPIPWHMIYNWQFYDVSEVLSQQEGGGFGFGRFRARYFHANSDRGCVWEDFAFPQDTWQKDPPLPVEDYDPSAVCIALEVISDVVPAKFQLADNYPNPFNPTTNISFSIPMELDIQVNIYNLLGQRVATFNEGQLNAGTYNIRWNGRDQMGNPLASGIYFYELQAGNQFKQIKKMTFVK